MSQVPNAIKLKDKVVKGGGRVVIRPDSGNPENVPVECVDLLMKASAIMKKGYWSDVFKSPVTDSGKVSKKGLLALVEDTGVGSTGYSTVRIADAVGRKKVLVPVYKDGKVLKTYTFKEIRANSEA